MNGLNNYANHQQATIQDVPSQALQATAQQPPPPPPLIDHALVRRIVDIDGNWLVQKDHTGSTVRYWCKDARKKGVTCPAGCRVSRYAPFTRIFTGIHTTNNAVESHNKQLNSDSPTPHPSMFQLIDRLKARSLAVVRKRKRILEEKEQRPERHEKEDMKIPADLLKIFKKKEAEWRKEGFIE
jgi:hypothetical protein